MDEGWDVFFTQDTHWPNTYENSMEGKLLPIPHCLEETSGWYLVPELKEFWEGNWRLLKHRFGDIHLYDRIEKCIPEEAWERDSIKEIFV